MGAIELIAFDLDGTVFASPFVQEVSARVGRAFARAAQTGAHLVVCSGRPAHMLGPSLPVEPWLSWAILTNGALVTPYGGGAAAGAPMLERPMSRPLAIEAMRTVADAGGCSMIHTGPSSYADQTLVDLLRAAIAAGAGKGGQGEATRGNYGLGAFGSCVVVDSALEAFCADPALHVFKLDAACASIADADRLEERLRGLTGIEVARTNPTSFEVTAAGVSKGLALDWLCERLGVDPARAVAFGDSANDLSLAGHAGTFVAMGNAADEVKAAADDVCESVLDDGVARWLEARL